MRGGNLTHGEGGGPVTFPRGEPEERVRRSRVLREQVKSDTMEARVDARMRDIVAYREQHG